MSNLSTSTLLRRSATLLLLGLVFMGCGRDPSIVAFGFDQSNQPLAQVPKGIVLHGGGGEWQLLFGEVAEVPMGLQEEGRPSLTRVLVQDRQYEVRIPFTVGTEYSPNTFYAIVRADSGHIIGNLFCVNARLAGVGVDFKIHTIWSDTADRCKSGP